MGSVFCVVDFVHLFFLAVLIALSPTLLHTHASVPAGLCLQASRPASVLYFACRIFNVVGTSNATAFNELKKTQDLLQLLLSVRSSLGCGEVGIDAASLVP